jgi:hypothetical protein
MIFNIEDYKINGINAKRVSISVEAMILKDSAVLKALFYDEDGKEITHQYVLCSGPAYKLWKDDDFIINYVFERLNIKIKK